MGSTAEEMFWANEHARSGWSDSTSPAKSPEPELFALHGPNPTQAKHICTVCYLGRVRGSQRPPEDLVASIDFEKRVGNVAWTSSAESRRLLVLTMYGIKVTDMKNEEVFLRVSMNQICSAVWYSEANDEHMMVIEVDDGKAQQFSYYVFQVPDDNPDPKLSGSAARTFCKTIGQAFEVVHSKTVLENAI